MIIFCEQLACAFIHIVSLGRCPVDRLQEANLGLVHVHHVCAFGIESVVVDL